MNRYGIVLGADKTFLVNVDSTMIRSVDISQSMLHERFYKTLNYQTVFEIKKSGNLPISILLLGKDDGKVKRAIFILAPTKPGQFYNSIGRAHTVSTLPALNEPTTILYAWEYKSYNVLLYSNEDTGMESTLIVYQGAIRSLFKF